MIIKMDGFIQEVFLTGQTCSEEELWGKYQTARELNYRINYLPELFCRLHGFDVIPFRHNLKIDFVIDTDLDVLYKPVYM